MRPTGAEEVVVEVGVTGLAAPLDVLAFLLLVGGVAESVFGLPPDARTADASVEILSMSASCWTNEDASTGEKTMGADRDWGNWVSTRAHW